MTTFTAYAITNEGKEAIRSGLPRAVYVDTRAFAITLAYTSEIDAIITEGYTTVGDGGGATYNIVPSQIGSLPLGPGHFQLLNGRWAVLADKVVNEKQFGAVGDGTIVTTVNDLGYEVPVLSAGLLQWTGTDDTVALRAMGDWLAATGVDAQFISRQIIMNKNLGIPHVWNLTTSTQTYKSTIDWNGVRLINTTDQNLTAKGWAFIFWSNIIHFKGQLTIFGNQDPRAGLGSFVGNSMIRIDARGGTLDMREFKAYGVGLGDIIEYRRQPPTAFDPGTGQWKIGAAGAGYVVNDILTLPGTHAGVVNPGTIKVLTVGGGGQILTFQVENAGAYPYDATGALMGQPVIDPAFAGVAFTGGTGSGFRAYPHYVDIDTANDVDVIGGVVEAIDCTYGSVFHNCGRVIDYYQFGDNCFRPLFFYGTQFDGDLVVRDVINGNVVGPIWGLPQIATLRLDVLPNVKAPLSGCRILWQAFQRQAGISTLTISGIVRYGATGNVLYLQDRFSGTSDITHTWGNIALLNINGLSIFGTASNDNGPMISRALSFVQDGFDQFYVNIDNYVSATTGFYIASKSHGASVTLGSRVNTNGAIVFTDFIVGPATEHLTTPAISQVASSAKFANKMGTVTLTLNDGITTSPFPNTLRLEPGAYTIAHSSLSIPLTGSVAESVMATIPIGSNTMGINGAILIETVWSFTNNANAKTVRHRYSGVGGVSFHTNSTLANLLTYRMQCIISNRALTNSQFGFTNAPVSWGTSTAANITAAVDTTVTTSVVITAQLGNAADTISLERYLVQLIIPPWT